MRAFALPALQPSSDANNPATGALFGGSPAFERLLRLAHRVARQPCTRYRVHVNPKPLAVTMRAFRAGPAKILGEAARTGAKIHLGAFVLEVKPELTRASTIYGAMRSDVDPGSPSDWLRADDAWDADDD